jgi:superfamily II DNA or RNA helicase
VQLRAWQDEAISSALIKFQNPYSHFLCLATPGAGKTVMAAELARQLLDSGRVDLVVCVSPSTIIAHDFRLTLESITKRKFCGGLGASGQSITYQSMIHLDSNFWSLFEHYRVFAIFDEIHHCAGQDQVNANAWGRNVFKHIQNKAFYTLALTGTPWRSDTIPITLCRYTSDDSMVQVDFKYNLKRAIKENVCRVPVICAIDNELIYVTNKKEAKSYESFEALLADGECTYSNLIQHESIIKYMLTMAVTQLNREREMFPDAGGLIVASSTAHAKHIQKLMISLGESSVLVSYQEQDPTETIARFKKTNQRWIISIGMISEGTNIPRLRVCCYLSQTTTELYFRQVLGRILRVHSSDNETGYFFMLAHPSLVEYARRVAEEVPHIAVFNYDNSKRQRIIHDVGSSSLEIEYEQPSEDLYLNSSLSLLKKAGTQECNLDDWSVTKIGSFGRFYQQIYQL